MSAIDLEKRRQNVIRAGASLETLIEVTRCIENVARDTIGQEPTETEAEVAGRIAGAVVAKLTAYAKAKQAYLDQEVSAVREAAAHVSRSV